MEPVSATKPAAEDQEKKVGPAKTEPTKAESKISKKALKRQKKLEDWARIKLEKKVPIPLIF